MRSSRRSSAGGAAGWRRPATRRARRDRGAAGRGSRAAARSTEGTGLHASPAELAKACASPTRREAARRSPRARRARAAVRSRRRSERARRGARLDLRRVLRAANRSGRGRRAGVARRPARPRRMLRADRRLRLAARVHARLAALRPWVRRRPRRGVHVRHAAHARHPRARVRDVDAALDGLAACVDADGGTRIGVALRSSSTTPATGAGARRAGDRAVRRPGARRPRADGARRRNGCRACRTGSSGGRRWPRPGLPAGHARRWRRSSATSTCWPERATFRPAARAGAGASDELIVDAHHHIWRVQDLAWLERPDDPAHLRPVRADAGATTWRRSTSPTRPPPASAQSVYVQANWPLERSLDEVDWVHSVHERDRLAARDRRLRRPVRPATRARRWRGRARR